METRRDEDFEIYLVRKEDNEFMLISLMSLIFNAHIIIIDITYVYCVVIIILFYVFIRALKVLFLILYSKSFLIPCNNNIS